MIRMLSRFDLKAGTDFQKFAKDYYDFVEAVKRKGLAEATGKIGQRVSNTPMDTDEADAQKYYVVMSFRDRNQLDSAYDYMIGDNAEEADLKFHSAVTHAICNPVFTCWQE